MLFNSVSFLVFFPIVTLIYYIIPFKIKWLWLLIASYFFYMCWNPAYLLLMFTSTLITYLSGILIHGANKLDDPAARRRRKKLWVAISFIANLSILFFFKYFDFTVDNINIILGQLKLQLINPSFDVLLPVGISFYTFQALSYTMDVYRDDIPVEKHFGKYALFVSFFPQLVAGPIERSGALLSQIHEEHKFNYNEVKNGLLIMLFGFFQKVVIADWLAMFVDSVFNSAYEQPGYMLAIAVVCFAVQIYCDFSGYSFIAIGAAKVMGFKLMENFRQPYFATSIQDFWRRWHISLSTWFRDYLYFPLGGSRVSKLKKYRNIMIVFLVSGLWHGASWSFIIWGGLHGIYQIAGDVLSPAKEKLYSKLKINTKASSFKFGKQLVTVFLVCFAWIFFRAGSATKSFYIIKKIFTNFNLSAFSVNTVLSAFSNAGITTGTIIVILFSVFVLWSVSYLREHKYGILNHLAVQNLIFRWIVYYAIILFILIFGAFGISGTLSQFIYFQF